jgi:hypothetical protein
MMAADKSWAIASKTDDLCIILCFSNNLLGTTFDWKDLIAYTIGIAIVFWVEKDRQ